MPTYGEIIEVVPHLTTGDGDAWRCRGCGAAGAVTEAQRDQFVEPTDLAAGHVAEQAAEIVPKLAPSQFAAALLHGTAGDTQQVAAVELLVAHGHWMGYGYLRHYVVGGWNALDGRLYLKVRWRAVRRQLGELYDVERALGQYGDDGAAIARRVRRLAEQRAEVATHRADPVIVGSSTEITMLRVACSLAGHGWVSLGADLASLGNVHRGLVLTAVGHLLSAGGRIVITADPSWGEQ